MVRLHAGIGSISPHAYLQGLRGEILAPPQVKLQTAREWRNSSVEEWPASQCSQHAAKTDKLQEVQIEDRATVRTSLSAALEAGTQGRETVSEGCQNSRPNLVLAFA